MYVKSLRVAGFKSFAAPTVLEFESGINVIVGPNGSGKSNISDALSWVLGSQAPSTLRGASMEDVIFAGSSARPRLGMAEVELTLDNASRLLPLDLAEVTLSRSTDRSGNSEYRINGGPCRLLDIMELLSDTGMGRSIHTVVGQGQLDQVLQARAEERRAFIEEAAQIGKYRRRKERSLRKIERVEENLLRLDDVLFELRRSLRPLKRQASQAAAYSEIAGEHRELRQRLAATEVARLEHAEHLLDLPTEEHRARLLADELANVRSRLESAGAERQALGTAAEDQRGVANGMGRAADRLDALARLAEERAGRLDARLAAETEEGYRERIRLLQDDRERFGRRAQELAATAEKTRAAAQAAQSELGEANSTRSAHEAAVAEARAAETSAAQDLVRAEGAEAAGTATLGSLEARVHAVVERRETKARELSEDGATVTRAEREVASLEVELDKVTELAAEAETALETTREHADALKEDFNRAHADRSGALAVVQVLDQVRAALTDLPDALARLEPLVERAAGAAEIATMTEADAAQTVADAETDVERRWQAVARHDEELQRLDALMSGAAERLSGRRRKREQREIELAALDEELARVREAQAAAQRSATEERAALPAKRAALRRAAELREEAERGLASARTAADELARKASAALMDERGSEERTLAALLRVEESEAGIADARRALEGLAGLRAALESARRRAVDVAETASAAARRAVRWAEQAEDRAARARVRAQEAEEQVTALRARERELETTLEEAARRRNEAEVRRAEMRARTAALSERALDEWGLTIANLAELEVLEEGVEEEVRARVEKLERDLKRLGPVNPRAAEEYSEMAERETFLVEQIEDLNNSKRDLMAIVRDVDATIVDVFSKAFEDVAREFAIVFERLFPGGNGALSLTDPADVLNSGIEVEARPPGKNVRKLSLLSGGERSLVALAFLFAIFRSRPSPFYLLDEVEAALDDVNLARFISLVQELEANAQVLIVTHQKRTMEAADVLYGVSMKDGVSQVVAKRMSDIPA